MTWSPVPAAVKLCSAIVAVVLLQACGGGGGDAGSSAPAPQPTPGPLAAIAGTYAADGQGAFAFVHADGLTVGGIFQNGDNALVWEELAFSGVMSPSSSTAASGTATQFVYAESHVAEETPMGSVAGTSSQSGSGTLQLSRPLGSTSTLTIAAAPGALPNLFGTRTLARRDPMEVFQGVPLAKLGGVYSYFDGFAGIMVSMNLDGQTGLFSGRYSEGCQVSGRIFAYDPVAVLYRMDVSLEGTGCRTPGSGSLVGTVYSTRAGHPLLVSFGLIGGRSAQLSMGHSMTLAALLH